MAFIDIPVPVITRGRKMDENEISVICKDGKIHSLVFNQSISKLIKEKGFTKIQLKRDDITGEIGIEINNNRGLILTTTGSSTCKNSKLGNKTWVTFICDTFGLSKDGNRHILKLTNNLSRLDNCLFYRIIK